MVTREELPRKVTLSKDLKKVKVIWVSEGRAFWTMVTAHAEALRQRSFKEEQRPVCLCTGDERNVGRGQSTEALVGPSEDFCIEQERWEAIRVF